MALSGDAYATMNFKQPRLAGLVGIGYERVERRSKSAYVRLNGLLLID